EMERIARDVGVSGADLSILGGKWPDAADPLYWRMNEIKLDRKEITHADPQVMRDLQRVCTVCASKRRCEHELANNPSDPAWKKYCQTRQRSRHWSLSELPNPRQIRCCKDRLASSSSRWSPFFHWQAVPLSPNRRQRSGA